MTPKKSPPKKTPQAVSSRADTGKSSLRSEAEARLAAKKTASHPEAELDTQRLLHELQVHQIELEMQNEELGRIQGELELSGTRYFNLFDLAPVGILTLNEEGVIQEANLTAVTQLGLTRNQLVKHALAHFILPQDQDIYYLHRQQLFESGIPQACEMRMLCADKSILWVKVESIISQAENGTHLCQAVLSDITRRKTDEEKMRLNEILYHTLIETSQDLIWQCDAVGRYIYLNPAWEEVFGYKLEEMLGKKFVDFQTPEYAKRDMLKFKRLLKGDLVKGLETVHLGKDGREIHLVFNAKQLLDADGKPAGTQGTAYDITERKQSEKELYALSSRDEAILVSVPDIIMEVDKDKVYTWANPAGLEFFGEGVIGKDADFYFEGEQATYDIVAPLFGGSEDVIYIESWQQRKDGAKRLLAWWCRVLKDSQGNVNGALSTARDITDRKQAEEALQESERRYRERATELETIMDIVPVALWVAQDPSCHSIIGNRTANELHRIQPDQNPSLTPIDEQQLRPSNMRIFHDGAEITAQELPLQVCASKGIEIRDFESQIVFDDGIVIHEIGNVKPLFDENGQPRGAVGAFTDITGLKQVEEDIRRRAEELDALQRTMLDITSAQNLPGLLESIVERACQLLGAAGGGLYLNDPAKEEVRCVVSYNTPANYVGVIVKHGEGVAGRVSQTGESISVEDYKNWAGRAQSFELDKQLSAVVGVPLLWGGQVRGVIEVLHYEKGKNFNQSDNDLLNLFAGHAAIAIENSRLLEASLAGEAEVRTLSTRLAEAEENERRRIARELHDQVGQSLSALSINMNIMSSQIPEYLPGFKRRLDDSLMLIDQTTDHIRNLMSELRPSVLDDYGLKAALDWAAESVSNRTTLKLLVEGECNRFPPRVEISLFRIAQEALGNITRHARARKVKILLTQDGPDMSMSVTDDGVGFDPSAVAATEKSGWGLRLMAERADSIGASLQVESTPGQGTTITVRYHDQDSTGG